MTIRIAAIEVGHWHAVHDAAYLRHLSAMPEVALVGVQDSDAALAKKRADAVGSPPTFTDYPQMLAETKPDFVLGLGRHRQMAKIAHDLLDRGLPFMMEKPMGISAAEVQSIAEKATRVKGYAAVPLFQRYQPFAVRARQLLAEGRFGPISHIYVRINRPAPARYPAWDSAWMLDPAEAGGGCLRNLGSHGLDMFLHLTGEDAQVTGAQISTRAHGQRVEDYASVLLRSAHRDPGHRRGRQRLPARGHRRRVEDRGAGRHPHAEGRRAEAGHRPGRRDHAVPRTATRAISGRSATPWSPGSGARRPRSACTTACARCGSSTRPTRSPSRRLPAPRIRNRLSLHPSCRVGEGPG